MEGRREGVREGESEGEEEREGEGREREEREGEKHTSMILGKSIILKSTITYSPITTPTLTVLLCSPRSTHTGFMDDVRMSSTSHWNRGPFIGSNIEGEGLLVTVVQGLVR